MPLLAHSFNPLSALHTPCQPVQCLHDVVWSPPDEYRVPCSIMDNRADGLVHGTLSAPCENTIRKAAYG